MEGYTNQNPKQFGNHYYRGFSEIDSLKALVGQRTGPTTDTTARQLG